MRFIGLSWGEQFMLLQAFCLAGLVRLAIIVLPFRYLAQALGKHMVESPMEEDFIKLGVANQIGWGVEAVSRYTPWESKCLVQAIVGKIMLRQHSITNTLYLGVGRNEENSLVAHAWLRCGETIITGGQGRERFTMVGKFADDENAKVLRRGGDTYEKTMVRATNGRDLS
jgi:hypothetical protein